MGKKNLKIRYFLKNFNCPEWWYALDRHAVARDSVCSRRVRKTCARARKSFEMFREVRQRRGKKRAHRVVREVGCARVRSEEATRTERRRVLWRGDQDEDMAASPADQDARSSTAETVCGGRGGMPGMRLRRTPFNTIFIIYPPVQMYVRKWIPCPATGMVLRVRWRPVARGSDTTRVPA